MSRSMTDERKSINLKRKVGRRAERGHLWVFSNEVETIQGDPKPGDEVAIYGGKGQFLGMGLVSQSSMIRARIYSRTRDERCDAALIRRRIERAIAYRRATLGEAHSYRLIHSEADGLPGLIIDVFGDQAVIQISTCAMDMRREGIVAALCDLLHPGAIIERSDVPYRKVEGLSERKEVIFGEAVNPCLVHENGVRIYADLLEGQKTGYFLDQVRNRTLAIPFFAGKRVLDLFCYIGGWSLVAAAHGAAETLGVDTSQPALDMAIRSAAENNIATGPDAACQFLNADVFTFLRQSVAAKKTWDVIVLDPPALAKSKKDRENAIRAYRELNIRAMQLLAPDGLLITCSCSHSVTTEDFHELLTMAAKDTRTDCALLYQASQSPDHPIHLQTPETGYLKAFFLKRHPF